MYVSLIYYMILDKKWVPLDIDPGLHHQRANEHDERQFGNNSRGHGRHSNHGVSGHGGNHHHRNNNSRNRGGRSRGANKNRNRGGNNRGEVYRYTNYGASIAVCVILSLYLS